MFVINLLLLPFRGLWSLFTGLLLSLPIWIIVGLCTVNFWLPSAIHHWIYYKTGFFCQVGSCNVNLMKGDVEFKDIILNNSKDFRSSDWIKLDEISCHFSLLQFFQKTVLIDQMTWKIRSFLSVNEGEKNNLQQFVANYFKNKSPNTVTKEASPKWLSKAFVIEQLTVSVDGNIGIRYYTLDKVLAQENILHKRHSFSNVCLNVPPTERRNLGETTSLETVYTNLISIFPTNN